ncbi:MAG: hypothetical protein Kow0062_08200 [Acidobacteriota bacterium]
MIRVTGRRALAPLAALATGCLIAGLALAYVAAPARVAGESMHPTLRSGDVVLMIRWPGRIRTIRRGDVVVADLGPAGAGPRVVKRVARVGRSGGRVLLELRGDAGAASEDSRRWGPVPLEQVRGVVVWRVYPRFGPLPGSAPAAGSRRAASPAGR